jgi:hypothetical protein
MPRSSVSGSPDLLGREPARDANDLALLFAEDGKTIWRLKR